MNTDIEDRIYGLVIGSAIADSMGSVMDIANQLGDDFMMTDPVDSYELDIEPGYWAEGTSLLISYVSSPDSLDGLINHGRWTSMGLCSNLSEETIICSKNQRHTSISTSTNAFTHKHTTDCLMRAPVVALLNHDNFKELIIKSFEQCDQILIEPCHICNNACKLYAAMIDYAFHGRRKKEILKKSSYENLYLPDELDMIFETYLQPLQKHAGEDNIESALATMLHCFATTDNFTDGLRLAVNNSEAPTRVGALYGQLAGVYYGLTDIKEEWLKTLKSRQILTKSVKKLMSGVER